MRFGITLPPFNDLADVAWLADVAADAEASGWDGFFLWDHIRHRPPTGEVADPWVALATIGHATDRIALGPMVTPVARRRPWMVAKQAATLDQLTGGRVVFGVGLGLDGGGRELSAFGEEMDDRRRASMLDESLELIDRLWSGDVVHHAATHYMVDGVSMLPRPAQQPRIPVWVAARYPHRRPLERAARWDGVFPIDLAGPDQLSEQLQVIEELRDGLDGFDVVVDTPGPAPEEWAAAGATWWLARFEPQASKSELAAAAGAGPPTG